MIKPLGGHDPLELKAVVVGIPFLYSSYLMLLRIPFGIPSQWLEPWQTDLWNLMAFCWAVGKFLLHGTGGETKQRAEVYAKHHSKSVAECPRTYLPAVVLWYLIFLSVGKIVTLRKHQLIETLCGIVTISARLCQGEFHISRFKCLTKPERSHRSSQISSDFLQNLKPDFSAGTGDMGRSPMGKTSLWIKLSRGWKTEG